MRPGVAAILALLLVGCGSNTGSDAGSGMDGSNHDRDGSFVDPDGGSASTTIGPAGGTVSLGQLTLTIPPGALTSEVEIGVEIWPPATDVPDGLSSSDVYRLTPEGLEFALPVTADFDAGSIPDGEAVIRWTRRGSMEWEVLETSVTGSVASAESDHFSWMDVVYGAACLLAAHGDYFQPCCEGMCFGALECFYPTEYVLPDGINLGVCDVDFLSDACGGDGQPCCLRTIIDDGDRCDPGFNCEVDYMRGQIAEGFCEAPCGSGGECCESGPLCPQRPGLVVPTVCVDDAWEEITAATYTDIDGVEQPGYCAICGIPFNSGMGEFPCCEGGTCLDPRGRATCTAGGYCQCPPVDSNPSNECTARTTACMGGNVYACQSSVDVRECEWWHWERMEVCGAGTTCTTAEGSPSCG